MKATDQMMLGDLDPSFRPLAERFLAGLDGRGIAYAVTAGLRTYADQKAAFAAGASKCDGLAKLSLHQAGLAIDVVPLDERDKPTWLYTRYPTAYKRIAAVARECGLECGQDWAPLDPGTGMGWDPPHYQFKGGTT